MWKVQGSNPGEQGENARALVAALKSLVGKVPHMISLEAGINVPSSPASWDVVLITKHSSWEELDAYRVHPEHQKVVQVVGSLTRDRAVVDWEG